MTYKFSQRSRDRLRGVHPDLVQVMALAITQSPLDMTIIEGPRSVATQEQNVASGASQTMNSKHLLSDHACYNDGSGTVQLCRAVDVAPYVDGTVSWAWPHYDVIAPVIKQAALDLGIVVEWGGDWSSFKDGPHWQLPT